MAAAATVEASQGAKQTDSTGTDYGVTRVRVCYWAFEKKAEPERLRLVPRKRSRDVVFAAGLHLNSFLRVGVPVLERARLRFLFHNPAPDHAHPSLCLRQLPN